MASAEEEEGCLTDVFYFQSDFSHFIPSCRVNSSFLPHVWGSKFQFQQITLLFCDSDDAITVCFGNQNKVL